MADMPAQSRIIMALLVGVIAVGLGFLVRGEMKTEEEFLFGGQTFNEAELAKFEAAFSSAGLKDWRRDGSRMRIPNDAKADYLSALQASSSLPMSVRSNLEDALDTASVFDSNDMRRAREMHAKERDVAQAITRFPDVRSATVTYTEGERIGLSRRRPQSAAVVIQPLGGSPLPASQHRAIREMVRGAFGMSADDVVLTDLNGTSSADAEDDDPTLKKQRDAERLIEQKVRGLLADYPARIAVSAEIDPSMGSEKMVLKYDAQPTTVASDSRKTETTNSERPPAGVPGVQPNVTSNRGASLDDMVQTRRTKEDERQTRSVTGRQLERSRLAALQVRRVTVSVGLPRSFYVGLHDREYKRANGEDADVPPLDDVTLDTLRARTTASIRAAVLPLLPPPADPADAPQLVSVTDFPDADRPPPAGKPITATAMTWLAKHWQALGMFALAAGALVVARGAGRNVAAPPREFEEGFGLDIPEPPHEPEAGETRHDMDITGESLQEELLRIVEGNPEVAANVIRSWVGEAA